MSHAILLALAPVFFVLWLGYFAGRRGIVDNRNVDALNKLVMDVALPASLFAAMASAPRSALVEQVPLFAILGGVMLATFAAWFWLARRVGGVGASDASQQALTIAFPNMAGVGLPIMAAVAGPSGAVPLAVALAAGSILVSPLSLLLVEMDRADAAGEASSTGSRVRTAIGHALMKPVVIAPAAGIVVSATGVEPGSVVLACLHLVGMAAPGVALFLSGLILSAQPFKTSRGVLAATALADVGRPLLAALVVWWLPVDAATAKAAVLLAAIPSGFFGILFGLSYKLDSGITGSMVIGSTAASIATLAVAIGVLY
jgi:malonate transporter